MESTKQTEEEEKHLKDYQDWLDDQETVFEEKLKLSYHLQELGNIY